MGEFIGRDNELDFLNSLYAKSGKKTCVVFGRRKVGKSELLKQFCLGKHALYIECIQGSERDKLDYLSKSISVFDDRTHETYQHFFDAFDDIGELCKKEPTVLVLDEFPYLMADCPGIPSVVQRFIDVSLDGTDTTFIICGSSISVMKRETTNYDRPLHGRFDFRLEVKPLPFTDCVKFHPNMPIPDALKLYLTVGGIPKYHLDRETETYAEYIIRHFFDDHSADFSNEVESMIAAEFAPMDRYLAVLNAISGGATSHKQIYERLGIDKSVCTKNLQALMDVGIVDKIHPVMGAPKQPIYRISDNMADFCLTIVRDSKLFALASPDIIYNFLLPRIHTFLGKKFEDMCSDYMRLNYQCLEIGKWWGPDESKEIREIDVVATVLKDGHNVAVFGECKFMTSPVSMGEFQKLQRNAQLVKTDLTREYVMFSVSGFSNELEDAADMGLVTLIGMDEMTSVWPFKGKHKRMSKTHKSKRRIQI